MYNSGFRSKTRTPDGVGTVAAQVSFVQKSDPQPTILSWSIQGSDDRALDPAGGQTVVVVGAGFSSGMTVTVGVTAIGSVTIVSSTQATFTAPAKTAGNYTLTMANSNGQAAILVPGLAYSTVVTWTTPAGSLGSTVETTAFAESVVATADSSITYTLATGTLPTGATLNGNGTITGTAVATASPTTYSFSVTATDVELQDSTQSFTITVDPDSVTWVSPPNGTNYALTGNQPMSNVTLNATAASGSGITYAANALPTGVSLSGNVIYGTPTVAETVSTLLTATANTTTRSSTEIITWVVSLGDIYWPYVSLLLNGVTPTTTFINDASLNNGQLTIAGDTRPSLFSPYENGYYSNYFDGNGDYLQGTSNAAFTFGTGAFTIEAWISPTVNGPTTGNWIYSNISTGSGNSEIGFIRMNDGTIRLTTWNTSIVSSTLTAALNVWTHVVGSFDGTTYRLFVNGVLSGTSTNVQTLSGTGGPYIGTAGVAGISLFTGYISNLRVIKGTAVYTTNFTPSTTPLTAVSGTSLLTCQSNRFIDNSNNNFAITRNGDVIVSPAVPFVTPTTSSYNTQYSTTFDGNGDYLTGASNANLAMGTGQYTVEFWIYFTTVTSTNEIFRTSTDSTSGRLAIYYSAGSLQLTATGGAGATSASYTFSAGQWYHVAGSRDSSNNQRLFVNGTLLATTTSTNDYSQTGFTLGAGQGSGNVNGCISNLRVVKGTAVYTSNFTPSTTPLTAISGTSLLTCQNATLIDNSTNALTITSVGQAQPVALSPFTMTTSSTTVTSLGSAYFDGTGDYLNPPVSPAYSFGTGDFTCEFWCYQLAGSNNGLFQISASAGGFTSAINGIAVAAQPGTGWLVYYANGSQVGSLGVSVLNTWYHIALVRLSGALKLYVNGVAFTVAANDTTNYTHTNAVIGGYYSTSYLWNGYISEFRVVKGTAVYTANFLPPQAPITPVTNTSLLTLQYNGGGNNNGFVDQSSFNNIITRSGNTTQGTFSPFSQTGWGTYYNGSNSYQYVPTNTAFAIGTADFTVEAWVYPTTSNQQYSVIFAGISYGSSSDWGLYLNESTISSAMKPSFLFANGGSAFSSGTTVSVGAWTHIAVARQGTTVRFFINGALTATTTSNASLLNSMQKGIGGGFNGNGSTLLTGYISNLRVVSGTAVYTSAFTPPTSPLTPIAGTILLTNQNSRWIDNSSNNFAITTGGTPTAQAYSPFGGVTSVPTSYSNYFDGSGDYLSTPSNAAFTLDGNFTVEAWVYLTAGGVSSGIISTYLPNTTYGVGLLLNTSNQLVFKIGNDASAGSNFIVTDATALQLNTWYHVAGVRSGNTMTLYKNGTSVGSTGSVTYTPATTTAVIGRYYTNTDNFYFIGYISNSRIVKGQALYTSNFTPSTTPLTTTSQGATASNVSLLTCQSATIVDNSPNYFSITANGNTQPYTFNPFGTTNTTGVSYTPAVNGGSMYFDGTGDKLTVANYPSLGFKANDFTIQAWCYTNAASTEQVIMTNGWSSYAPWLIRINSSNQVLLNMSLNGGSWYVNEAVFGTITVGQWFHVAVTRSSGILRAFLNGVQGYTTDLSTSALYDGSQALTIGGRSDTSVPMNGYISDAQLINGTSLYRANFTPPVAPATPTYTLGSTVAVSTLLASGTSGGIIDYHSTNDLETVGNTQLAPQDPYSGSYYSNYFAGSSNYLQAPSNAVFAFSGAFTVEGWFYWPAIPSAGTLCGPLTGGAFNFYTDGNYLSFNIFGVGNVCVVSSFPSRNVWHHIAMTRDASNNCTIWVDGVSSATGTSAHSFVQGVWTIYGGSNNGGTGYVSNFRVVKGTALYTSNFTPSTSPLTAVSGTSLLTCQSNTFKDNSTNNFTITVAGNTSVKSFNPFQQNTGKSLYFGTKTDTYAMRSIPSIANLPGDFTIECWVNPTDTSISTTWGILDARSAGASASAWLICLSSYSSGWLMNIYTGTSYSGTTRVQANQWTYLAWVRSGSTLTFYVNGVAGGTATVAGVITGGTTTVVLGSKDNGLTGYGTVGYIKDLRITQGVARYTANFTPPTTPFPSS